MADEKPRALTSPELEILLQRLPGWTVENNQLAKEFRLKDFVESVAFVDRLVPFFELKDHHPDIHISYSRVTFEISRHDIGDKITALCGEVAEHIGREYSALKG